MPKVVITMPAYRAEGTLARTVADIPPGVADKLILVDDASPDRTAERARELGIQVHVHPENRGYGGNQKTCYTEAVRSGADIVVMLHPDYQYDPGAVPLLIAPILAGEADMTFGSRFAGLSDPRGGGMPLYRFVGNRVTTVLQNVMLGSRFTEMHSGMRAYTRGCLLSMPFLGYDDDFVFDAQFMVDAVTHGQRVVEVPIPTRYTKESSSIAIGPSLRYIFGGLSYCFRMTRARGRRGKRWPVTWSEHAVPSPGEPQGRRQACGVCGNDLPRRGPCGACGFHATAAAGPAADPDLIPVLDAAESYLLEGRRLAVLGDVPPAAVTAARDRGWEVAVASDGDVKPADLVVVAQGPSGTSDPMAIVQRAAGMLEDDGVLGLVAPVDTGRRRSSSYAPTTIHTMLARAGLSMIDWRDGTGGAPATILGRRRTHAPR